MSNSRRTIQTTKNSTSQTSTASAQAIPMQPDLAAAAYTDEDSALEREIKRLGEEQQFNANVDAGPPDMKPAIENPELLSEHVEDYKPAHSHASLEEQVFHAKAVHADSIEVEDIVFKGIFGHVPAEPYAVYKGIKLYRIGMVAQGQAADRMTIERKVFGAPK